MKKYEKNREEPNSTTSNSKSMDSSLKDNLRTLIIFAVIALTGVDILSTHPEIWWLYATFVVIVIAILFIQARRKKKTDSE
jgi:Flp pilus assembly protein TadB